MANEILKGIAGDIKEVEVAINEAENLISAMKEAGETVTDLESTIRDLKVRKVKWENMLTSRGVM